MSKAPQIREKIKSINKTRTITKAMQMVATSKMRKARNNMMLARPYADKIRLVMSNLAQTSSIYKQNHSLLRNDNADGNIGVILITADKGLCGALNNNLIKRFIELKNSYSRANFSLSCVGQKAFNFAESSGYNIQAQVSDLGLKPDMSQVIAATNKMFSQFRDKNLDKVFLIYAKFVNAMKQIAVCEQLFPLSKVIVENSEKQYSADYLYEPSIEEVLHNLAMRYIEFLVYQGIADTIASEQAARMIAMKSATDNANVLINDLNVEYNKSRQSAITQELAEIVSGAASV